jgi:pilus assembly protein Flp/PilA
MLSIFRRLMKNTDGVTAIEYSLIAALIAIAAVTAMGYAGKGLSNTLSNVANVLK